MMRYFPLYNLLQGHSRLTGANASPESRWRRDGGDYIDRALRRVRGANLGNATQGGQCDSTTAARPCGVYTQKRFHDAGLV